MLIWVFQLNFLVSNSLLQLPTRAGAIPSCRSQSDAQLSVIPDPFDRTASDSQSVKKEVINSYITHLSCGATFTISEII